MSSLLDYYRQDRKDPRGLSYRGLYAYGWRTRVGSYPSTYGKTHGYGNDPGRSGGSWHGAYGSPTITGRTYKYPGSGQEHPAEWEYSKRWPLRALKLGLSTGLTLNWIGSLTDKDKAYFVMCIYDAIRKNGWISQKIIRDCVDKTKAATSQKSLVRSQPLRSYNKHYRRYRA